MIFYTFPSIKISKIPSKLSLDALKDPREVKKQLYMLFSVYRCIFEAATSFVAAIANNNQTQHYT